MKTFTRLMPLLAALLAAPVTAQPPESDAMAPSVRILEFICERPMTRVGRPMSVVMALANDTAEALDVVARLDCPEGLRVTRPGPLAHLTLAPDGLTELRWVIEADRPLRGDVTLAVEAAGATLAERTLPMRFLPPYDGPREGYIPPPEPAESPLLVGVHHCPLWEAEKPDLWTQIRKHPERTPALGFYSADNPEVADWETKWAREHGIDFFIYCWYRTSQGRPVETMFESAITDGLFHSRYENDMRWTIMWENQRPDVSGVDDEADLFGNLLPYWIETFFKRESYLKVDGKPVLFIYRPEFLVKDLGSVEAVRAAFDRMREACREEGFEGLYLLGEYRGTDPAHLQLMKDLGLDYTFAYCWYVHDSPGPDRAIDTQMQYIHQTEELGVLPQVVTLSQGWTGWQDEGSIWKLPAADFERLLRQGRAFVEGLAPDSLSSRMLILDNWNEWGEGHYIAPYTDEGFGYLDAARAALTDAPAEHVDLIPEDLGMGPYDGVYRARIADEIASARLMSGRRTRPEARAEEGLLAWWDFDEDAASPVAYDVAPGRHNGRVRGAERAEGRSGQALVCNGGCVTVDRHPLQATLDTLTLECWVKTDVAAQNDTWFVNCIYLAGTMGLRLGLSDGKPCVAIPQTAWSHHLNGDTDLPTGRWVHVAVTFDGQWIRLYMDGRECGSLERPGPTLPADRYLTLGSYEVDHRAHFTGLLDDVRIYGRALSADEIARRSGGAA